MWSASCSLSLQVRKENSADGDQMWKSSNRKGSLSPLPTRQQMVDKIIPNTILHQNSLLKRKGVALQTFSFNQIKKFCLIIQYCWLSINFVVLLKSQLLMFTHLYMIIFFRFFQVWCFVLKGQLCVFQTPVFSKPLFISSTKCAFFSSSREGVGYNNYILLVMWFMAF